jgi:hypothetical protein
MKIRLFSLAIVVYACGILTSSAWYPCCTNCVHSSITVSNHLCVGFNLVANPLCALNEFGVVDHRINNVLRHAPVGSSVMKWNVGGFGYLPADVYFGRPMGWLDDALMPSTTILDLFEGAFLQVSEPTTIVIFGCAPSCWAPPLAHGFSIRSCPVGMSFRDCIPGPADGDMIQFWDCARQQWEDPLIYFADMGWLNTDLVEVFPAPRVGEAFFYYHGGS